MACVLVLVFSHLADSAQGKPALNVNQHRIMHASRELVSRGTANRDSTIKTHKIQSIVELNFERLEAGKAAHEIFLTFRLEAYQIAKHSAAINYSIVP